jgi:pimeloyl-ACP methyl ester carboxylesterase
VVLLAGFGLDHEVWDAQVRELGPSYRTLAIDLRGTGRSDKPIDDYGMPRLVADVRTVLDRLDLNDVSLVGYSFGGQIGLALAATGDRRLSQLVLVCSNGVRASRSEEYPFGPPPDKLETALILGERSRRPAARRANVASGFHTSPDADLLDWLVAAQLRMPSWSAIACYSTYLHTDLSPQLPRIQIPVRQIVCADDPVTPVAGATWLQQRLADAELTVIENCGHYPMFEAADRFDAALAGYLAQI